MGVINQEDLRAFNNMTAAADATSVDLFGENKAEPWTDEEMHTALDVAGLIPVVGNIADAFNAATYAIEGEFGKAALSLTALVPVVGQMATVNKLAKESGEKMVTLFRGVDKWHPGQMVVNGNFVGGGKYVGGNTFGLANQGIKKTALFVTGDLNYAKGIFGKGFTRNPNAAIPNIVLEFQVPESLVTSALIKTGQHNKKVIGFFENGLPKEFLKKVHKIDPGKSYSQFK